MNKMSIEAQTTSGNFAKVPPMGWNSWNTFYDQYDEKLLMEIADVMADRGYRDAGYRYLIIDDCWALRERDENGKLVPDPAKFPGGIENLIRYIHEKGLKFGLYACCGVRTCAGYPGSFEHEVTDAKTFASWGVDYLKYDNCHRPASQGSEMLYRRMSFALRSTGRDILLAACQWGTEGVGQWLSSSGAHTYRSTIDIQDTWESIRQITEKRLEVLHEGGPGHFNDMDMLVAGMYGKGVNPETSSGETAGCTSEEYQTHFALWAMLNSPLILGCDIRHPDETTKKLLTNPDLIAINQDPEARNCYKLVCDCSPSAFTLVRPMSDGSLAAGIFNMGEAPVQSGFSFWDLGLSSSQSQHLRIYDCLRHTDLGLFREAFSAPVPAHGCQVYRCFPA